MSQPVSKKTILILLSNPKGTAQLDLLGEVRKLKDALISLGENKFDVEWEPNVKPEDWLKHISRVKPQIIHFCGHGTKEGLRVDDGNLLCNEYLVNLLKQFADRVECVLLNACDTEPLAKALANHINYAIGMNMPVKDKTAIKFSEYFYRQLGIGDPIEKAFNLAVNEIYRITSPICQNENDNSQDSRKLSVIIETSENNVTIKNHNEEHLILVLCSNPNPTTINPINESYKGEGLGIHDKTRVIDSHFKIEVGVGNHEINICDFYIEPNYSINSHNSLPEIQTHSNSEKFITAAIRLIYKQKILIIAGDYGCGKTFLSKIIQFNLINQKQKEDVAFIKCSDIANIPKYEDYTLFLEDAKLRKYNTSNLVIVFDGFEEVNFLHKDKTEIKDRILKNIIRLSQENNFYVILNTRKTLSSSSNSYNEDLLLEISLHLIEETQKYEFEFLHINYFSRPQIENFLDSFANEMGKIRYEARLSYSEIKRVNKKILKACENPLFIYMLNLFFYKNSCDISQAQIYLVYEEFVKSTIRGKFRGISPAIQELNYDYEKYLIDIASLINTKNQIQSSETNYDEWQLDSNIASYVVKLKDLKPEIIKLATKLEENISNNLDKSRVFSNVLSCYFFEILGDKCRFKDNNILFFFLAKKWLILLENIFSEYDCDINENAETFYQNLINEGISHINPTIFDFILRKIHSNNDLRLNLINFIEQILNNKLLFFFKNNQFSDSNLRTRITVDFVLLILFINLNTNSYHDFPDFFDWVNWYVKVCSSFIADCENTLKTMFRRICLYNLKISRFNLDGYNFDHAKISDTRFYQVDFIETRMNYVEFDDVGFELCFIDDLSIDESYGSVKFSDCRIIDINGCPFSATGIKNPLFIEFENCYIKKITITANNNGDGNSSRINFKFRNCNIEEIIFRGSKSNEINFLDTKYNRLDISQSEVSLIKLENTKCPDNIYTGNPSFDPQTINR